MLTIFRICLLILFAVTLTVPSVSQIKFSVGPKAGLNVSSLSVDPDPYQGNPGISKSGILRLVAAAQIELLFGGMFGVQIEPGYNGASTKWQNQQGASETISISKIDIPILFKILLMSGTFQPYGFAGPCLGIVASATQKVDLLQGAPQETDIKSNVSSLDFALAFGGGAKFNLTKSVALTGDVRYALGLSNVDARQVQQGATAPSAKSRGFMIQFGALFSL
ncbi:MAG: PorT family protein [Bacteroidetes bacterium]|nr:PorT family protein [Bacteroidota bacterium]MCW5896274.1 PorT family protein [Bacteroidota bacterium]